METGALGKLQHLEAALRAAGVKALYLFGSEARGKTTADSDVDLLFEADPLRFSLLDQAKLQSELSRQLGRPVDLIERDALHPMVRRQAESEMVRVF